MYHVKCKCTYNIPLTLWKGMFKMLKVEIGSKHNMAFQQAGDQAGVQSSV
jgi:hypothetical protein